MLFGTLDLVEGHINMAKRDYKKEYREYHGKPEQVKRRSSRNKARRKLGIEKDRNTAPRDKRKTKNVHHKDGNPNNNSKSNLAIRSPKNQRKEGGRKSSGRKGK